MTEQDEIKQYGRLVAKAWGDPAFKAQLLADPAGTLRAEGFTVREGMQVRVLEPDGPRLYLPLPAELPAGEQPTVWVEVWRRAQAEPDFKTRLLAEPAAVLAEQGLEVPARVPIEVVEVSDVLGYIAVPPAPEELDGPSNDVAGYFTCNAAPSASVPREVVPYWYHSRDLEGEGSKKQLSWAPVWTAPLGIGAVVRPLS